MKQEMRKLKISYEALKEELRDEARECNWNCWYLDKGYECNPNCPAAKKIAELRGKLISL